MVSVSGTIPAVCSCTILPLFSGIYKMGAALGLILISCFQMRPWKVGLTAIPAIALAIVFQEQTLIVFTAGFIGLSVFISTDKGESAGGSSLPGPLPSRFCHCCFLAFCSAGLAMKALSLPNGWQGPLAAICSWPIYSPRSPVPSCISPPLTRYRSCRGLWITAWEKDRYSPCCWPGRRSVCRACWSSTRYLALKKRWFLRLSS